MLRLRIRGPSGAATLELGPDATRTELEALVSAHTAIPAANLELRLGFPRPQILPPSAPDATLKSLGITNGETIQASIIATPSDTPPTKSVAPKPTSSKPYGASVPVNESYLVLRIVPDDNSCLFRAVGLCLEHGDHSGFDISLKLRKIVAQAVKENPLKWSEPLLGKNPKVYIDKILDKNVWGGAIELAILSEYYKTEICSIDVLTGRVDRFGEIEKYSQMIILVYSGIHYDALTLSPIQPTQNKSKQTFPPDNIEFDTTIFTKTQKEDENQILKSALNLVNLLREQHYYTDTATFTLKCTICSVALVGEADARKHAEQTGHTQFGEYA